MLTYGSWRKCSARRDVSCCGPKKGFLFERIFLSLHFAAEAFVRKVSFFERISVFGSRAMVSPLFKESPYAVLDFLNIYHE